MPLLQKNNIKKYISVTFLIIYEILYMLKAQPESAAPYYYLILFKSAYAFGIEFAIISISSNDA